MKKAIRPQRLSPLAPFFLLFLLSSLLLALGSYVGGGRAADARSRRAEHAWQAGAVADDAVTAQPRRALRGRRLRACVYKVKIQGATAAIAACTFASGDARRAAYARLHRRRRHAQPAAAAELCLEMRLRLELHRWLPLLLWRPVGKIQYLRDFKALAHYCNIIKTYIFHHVPVLMTRIYI